MACTSTSACEGAGFTGATSLKRSPRGAVALERRVVGLHRDTGKAPACRLSLLGQRTIRTLDRRDEQSAHRSAGSERSALPLPTSSNTTSMSRTALLKSTCL